MGNNKNMLSFFVDIFDERTGSDEQRKNILNKTVEKKFNGARRSQKTK